MIVKVDQLIINLNALQTLQKTKEIVKKILITSQ